MSVQQEDFIKILKNEKKLKAYLKTLTIDEIEEIAFLFQKIVEDEKQIYQENQKRIQEKNANLQKLREFAETMNLPEVTKIIPKSFQELIDKSKKKLKLNKYRIKNSKGRYIYWNGEGKIPVAFKEKIEAGHQKEEFLIDQST